MFENKKIFILGMARSGYAAARVLSKMNNTIVLNDKSDNQDISHVKELEELGIKVILGSHPDDILDESFDYIIKNPGVHFDHKYLAYAEKHGIKVINEIEMAYHLLPKGVTIIAVTGTNGKTTTTSLIYEVVNSYYHKRTHLAGNIGFPLCEVLENIKENDYLVMEIGVPQLHDFYDFNPHISILTNIFEAHLDMFGTREYYNENKLRIFMNHTKDDIAIINKGNEDSCIITENIKSTKKYFSSKELIDGCYLLDGKIYYYDEYILDTAKVKLQGVHNYENIMCAVMAAKKLDIPNEVIAKVIQDFSGVEHRIEYVKTINGVDYYNDSKSTNIKATETALSAFKRPVILLLGGIERTQNFLDLKDYLNYTKLVVCYGECKKRIENEMKELGIKTIVTDNLEEATLIAKTESIVKDVVLLSPASASWDQYENFEARGTEFKKIVNNLN